MKFGLVGVGDHGRALAATFVEQGAELAGYNRESNERPVGINCPRMEVDRMAIELDAVVIAAPPAATLEAALYCARVGVPVLATKPLMLKAPIDLRDVFFVDYWRLWNPEYLALKEAVQTAGIVGMAANFFGKGPFRGFLGIFDYGPHALAYLHDLVDGDLAIATVDVEGNTERGDRVTVVGSVGELACGVQTGNGYTSSSRSILVRTRDGATHKLSETPNGFGYSVARDGLNNVVMCVGTNEDRFAPMVRAFMDDVRTGTINPKTMLMSVAITADLKKIQQAVAPDR